MTNPVLTITALEVRRELPRGKTKPLVCLCEGPDNDTDEFVVKFRSRVTNDLAGLAAEYIAARLAACLGIPQPQFAIVDISAELIESSTGTVYEEVLRENLWIPYRNTILRGLFNLDSRAVLLLGNFMNA